MASLDQFTDTSAASLDAFQIEAPLVPINNEKSNRNLAAYTAALSGDPDSVEANYLQTVNDQGAIGSSPTFERVKKRANEQSFIKNRQALIDVLTDPALTDEQKRNAATSVLDQTNELYNVRNAVSEAALIQDSKDETVEAEAVRISLAGAIDEVNRYKYQMQARLNAEIAKSNPSILSTVADITEIIVPFTEGKAVGSVLSDLRGGDVSAYPKAMALLGEGKEELSNMLRKLPPSQRGVLSERIINVINQNSNIVLPDDNDFVRVDLLRTALEQGYYDDVDKWIDTTISLLDVIGLGTLAKGAIRGLKGVKGASRGAKAEGVEGEFIPGGDAPSAGPTGAPRLENSIPGEVSEKSSVRTRVQPVTLSQNYKDTNPEKARAANDLAGQSDEVAEAMYGTNRTEAVANDELPEIQRSDGGVKSKTSIPNRSPRFNKPPPRPRVMDFADKNGAIYLTDAEKASAATKVVHDFNNALGLTTRKEMTTPKSNEIGGGFDVEVTYGPKDMGWSNGEDAIELVKWSMRHYGVKDSDLTLMRRYGDEYRPVKAGEATESGDYLVKVKYPYQISATDIDNWDDLDVKNNFLDRSPHLRGAPGGSFARHIIDAHSMLHPNISLGANVAVDKGAALEKILLEQTQEFSKPYGNLPKDRQNLLEGMIKQMNYEGEFPSTASMRADGLDAEEINTLKAWRDIWDTMYWLENGDLVKSLRNRGFGVVEDSATDSRVFAKSISRQQAGSHQRALDLETGEMRTVEGEELRSLYEDGGTLARMRQPTQVGDEAAEMVIVKNKPSSSYIRGLRDDDTVLNYREGYYSVYYTDPHFIVKVVKDSKGNKLYERAVATAKTKKEADLLTRRMAQTDGGEYYNRGDVKKMRFDSDQNWDLQMANGRTAQRIRGERLEDASSPINDPSHNNIMGPVDSLITSVRSVSSRVPMRDYIEATKQRAITQYGEFFPTNRFGQAQFPASSKEISAPGKEASSRVADARTTVEYITFLENGYINSMDEGIKAVFQGVADALGVRGFETGERVARAASEIPGPTSIGRNTAFTLYLALNPLRQALIQAHQGVQLFAINPKYVAGQMSNDMAAFMDMWANSGVSRIHQISTGRSKEELEKMWQAFQESGLSASIDKQSLVRGSLTQIAENSRIAGRKNIAARGIAATRKAGFDLGENLNMMSSWLAHYDMAAKRSGKSIKGMSQRDLDNISARARDFTYNMNRAGDMPYNENSLGLLFQFMQVPHKAVLQMTTNRNLTKTQKLQLATFNTLMYGAPPTAVMYGIFSDILPEDGELREVVTQGLEGYIFNKGLSLATGYDVGIDFSGLAASDMASLYEFLTSLMTMKPGEIVAATPAGGLLFGGNARLTNFAKEVSQYFRFTEPEEGSPPELSEVFQELAKLSSGYSNAFKARMALEYGKRYNAYGGVVDSRVSTPEAMARIFGFGTLDEAQYYYVTGQMYEKKKSFEDDVKKAYKEVKRGLTKEGVSVGESEWILRVNNWMMKAFEDSPKAMQIIQQQMKYDAEQGDVSLFKRVLRTHPYMDNETTRDIISNLPEGQGNKEALRRTLEYIDSHEDE